MEICVQPGTETFLIFGPKEMDLEPEESRPGLNILAPATPKVAFAEALVPEFHFHKAAGVGTSGRMAALEPNRTHYNPPLNSRRQYCGIQKPITGSREQKRQHRVVVC